MELVVNCHLVVNYHIEGRVDPKTGSRKGVEYLCFRHAVMLAPDHDIYTDLSDEDKSCVVCQGYIF